MNKLICLSFMYARIANTDLDKTSTLNSVELAFHLFKMQYEKTFLFLFRNLKIERR